MTATLGALMRKELLQFWRDRFVVALVLYTFLEAAICGWALFLDARNLPVAVLDQDRSAPSRELVSRLGAAPWARLVEQAETESRVMRLLERGDARLAVIIPRGFARDLWAGRTARVQVLADGADANSAALGLSYVAGTVRQYAAPLEIQRLGPGALAGGGGRVLHAPRAWYDPPLEFSHFTMISMVSMAAFMLAVVLAAAGVMREKEAGTLEQIMVTPVRPWQLVLAKIVPLTAIMFVGLAVALVMSVLGFGVPVRGSLTLFFGLALLIFLAGKGLGILVATAARNMQQALLLVFFLLFPMIFLSGTVTPVQSMPAALQWLSYLSPVRYYLEINVGVLMKGVGMETLWPTVAGLAALGLAFLWWSVARFRKSLA